MSKLFLIYTVHLTIDAISVCFYLYLTRRLWARCVQVLELAAMTADTPSLRAVKGLVSFTWSCLIFYHVVIAETTASSSL